MSRAAKNHFDHQEEFQTQLALLDRRCGLNEGITDDVAASLFETGVETKGWACWSWLHVRFAVLLCETITSATIEAMAHASGLEWPCKLHGGGHTNAQCFEQHPGRALRGKGPRSRRSND